MAGVNVIRAIHDSDLERVLRRLGLYERVARGEFKCAVCGEAVTLENLGGVYRENGMIKFVCSKITCLVEVARRISKK
mgnify:CR=1 FL=1